MPCRPPRLMRLLPASLALLTLLLVACNEQVKPTAVHLIDVSPGAEIIQQGGAAEPAAPGDIMSVGTGVKLKVPPGGHAYVFVRETRIVSHLGGDASWPIDDLLVLTEPATDVSIEEQLSTLQRDKRSPTVSDARVAAFHQGVQAAVTVGHEERRASKETAPEEAPPAKAEAAQVAGAAPSMPEDAANEGEEAPAPEATARPATPAKTQKKRGTRAEPSPPVDLLSADKDKPVRRSPPTLPATEGARQVKEKPRRLTQGDAKGGAGATRDGLGLSGAGRGGGGRPPGGKSGAPVVTVPQFSGAGVVLELKGPAAVTKRAAPALKAAHAAVLKCAAVKKIKGDEPLVVVIKRRRGKASINGSTPCVHKALSAIRVKVPAGTWLRVVIRPVAAGR